MTGEEPPTLNEAIANEFMYISTVVQTADGPRSRCCHGELKVTRIVSDLMSYNAVEVYDGGADGDVMTLVVNSPQHKDSLDSGPFEVECRACGNEVAVEVEET